jgi:hypothetical protein
MAPALVAVDERPSESSDTIIKKDVKQRWVSYIWDTLDKSPEERKLLFKLDTAILTFASLGESSSLSCIGNTSPNGLTLCLQKVTSSNIWIRSISIMLSCLECEYRPRIQFKTVILTIIQERGPWSLRKSTQLHADSVDRWLCNW